MKILVVEDTQANLEVAKSFFSQITEHEFIYAENFLEAMNSLLGADAVITDHSMPYCSSMKLPETWSWSDYHYVSGGFGAFIYVKCIELGIPVVSISEHGRVIFYEYNVSKWDDTATSAALKKLNENLSYYNEKFGRNDKTFTKEELGFANYCQLIDGLVRGVNLNEVFINHNLVNFGDICSKDVYERLRKQDSESWSLAWQKLQQKFE